MQHQSRAAAISATDLEHQQQQRLKTQQLNSPNTTAAAQTFVNSHSITHRHCIPQLTGHATGNLRLQLLVPIPAGEYGSSYYSFFGDIDSCTATLDLLPRICDCAS